MSRLPGIAVRNVGRNRRRSLITGITIAFGVAMVIVVRGFTGGMSATMIDDIVNGRIGAIQVHRAGFVDNIDAVPTSLNMPDDPKLRARIKAVPHVTGVTGRIQFNGLVSNGARQTMFVGRGIDVATETEACPRVATTVRPGGKPLESTDTKAVLLGFELGESFELKPGTPVSLQTTSPAGRANALELPVKGFTSSSLPFENQRVLTVPLATAQSLLGLEGRVTELAVGIDDLSQIDAVAANLRAELGPELEVHTWRELQPFLRDLINRQNFVLGAIGFVLFVIVLTGIINTMLMSVYERVREIGTMLAVGVRRRQVMTLFLLEAAVIGLGGGLFGATVGRTFCGIVAMKGIPMPISNLGNSSVLRPVVSWEFVAAAVLVAVVGAVGAALWPAMKASKLNPVDALRS